MSTEEAEKYHAEQIKIYSCTEADLVSASTICYAEEAKSTRFQITDTPKPTVYPFRKPLILSVIDCKSQNIVPSIHISANCQLSQYDILFNKCSEGLISLKYKLDPIIHLIQGTKLSTTMTDGCAYEFAL